MKHTIVFSALLVCALGASVALADDSESIAAKSYAKDSAIFVAVKSKLKAEHVDGYSHLDVTADANGEVWLKGTVLTQAQADRAVALAKEAQNVKAVHNQLVVKNSN
jgi:osmotically-inducible protein OsmY